MDHPRTARSPLKPSDKMQVARGIMISIALGIAVVLLIVEKFKH